MRVSNVTIKYDIFIISRRTTIVYQNKLCIILSHLLYRVRNSVVYNTINALHSEFVYDKLCYLTLYNKILNMGIQWKFNRNRTMSVTLSRIILRNERAFKPAGIHICTSTVSF